jgi:hypothetical protein
MNRESIFYNQAMQQRITLSEVRGPLEAGRASLFIDRARRLAQAMQVDGFPDVHYPTEYEDCTPQSVAPALFAVERFLNEIHTRNIFILDAQLNQSFVTLDDTWRSRVSTLLAHVRDHVRKADIEERLRNSIMSRINALQSEVERNQTRVMSASEVMVELCGAVGQGAEKLKPAVRIIEKVVGALRGIQREAEKPQGPAALPAPEKLGLPSPEEAANTAESE